MVLGALQRVAAVAAALARLPFAKRGGRVNWNVTAAPWELAPPGSALAGLVKPLDADSWACPLTTGELYKFFGYFVGPLPGQPGYHGKYDASSGPGGGRLIKATTVTIQLGDGGDGRAARRGDDERYDLGLLCDIFKKVEEWNAKTDRAKNFDALNAEELQIYALGLQFTNYYAKMRAAAADDPDMGEGSHMHVTFYKAEGLKTQDIVKGTVHSDTRMKSQKAADEDPNIWRVIARAADAEDAPLSFWIGNAKHNVPNVGTTIVWDGAREFGVVRGPVLLSAVGCGGVVLLGPGLLAMAAPDDAAAGGRATDVRVFHAAWVAGPKGKTGTRTMVASIVLSGHKV